MSNRTVTNLVVLAALAFAYSAADAGTRIYKTVDADGNVVFTDVPPLDQTKSEEVRVGVSNTFTPPAPEVGTQQVWNVGEDGEQVTQFAYNRAAIIAPANDASLRDNAGNVSVKTSVSPNLRPGHKLRLMMDEAPVGSLISASEFALSNVDRGSHSLRLQIVDQAGTVIFDGAGTTFHLQRVSVTQRTPPSVN